MDLEGMGKPTESKIEGQTMLPLKALIIKNNIKMPPPHVERKEV
jgi:hypothetical protein